MTDKQTPNKPNYLLTNNFVRAEFVYSGRVIVEMDVRLVWQKECVCLNWNLLYFTGHLFFGCQIYSSRLRSRATKVTPNKRERDVYSKFLYNKPTVNSNKRLCVGSFESLDHLWCTFFKRFTLPFPISDCQKCIILSGKTTHIQLQPRMTSKIKRYLSIICIADLFGLLISTTTVNVLHIPHLTVRKALSNFTDIWTASNQTVRNEYTRTGHSEPVLICANNLPTNISFFFSFGFHYGHEKSFVFNLFMDGISFSFKPDQLRWVFVFEICICCFFPIQKGLFSNHMVFLLEGSSDTHTAESNISSNKLLNGWFDEKFG